jgi:glycosyltransferase involved in cell wall biosynthesis
MDGEGARVVAEAGAGVTCPAEDAAALADAVLRLRAMRQAEREQLGANARRYFARHFEPGRLAEQLEALLAGRAPDAAAGTDNAHRNDRT